MTRFTSLLSEVRACTICEENLPHQARPILQIDPQTQILIAGQAQGNKVHKSGVPFDEPRGNRLREWMEITREVFYDSRKSRFELSVFNPLNVEVKFLVKKQKARNVFLNRH